MMQVTKRIFAAVLLIITITVLSSCGIFVDKIEVYDDIAHYDAYMSFAHEDISGKWNKWGMDEAIWPKSISDDMNVVDFKMVYYDPWDAQYLGYLVVDYSPVDYKTEVSRLQSYQSTDYIGYYGVKEEKTYTLLAVNADEYNGFVYALTDGNNRIIYAEEIFCNYFMDLKYEDYIPQEYLLDGFDASPYNPYMKEIT